MSHFNYYFNNAKDRLSEPHRVTGVMYKRTDRGDHYVQINYSLPLDPNGQFVSIFYDNEKQLNKIKNEILL